MDIKEEYINILINEGEDALREHLRKEGKSESDIEQIINACLVYLQGGLGLQ